MINISRWKELGLFFATRDEFNSFIYGAQDEDIQAKVDSLKQNEYPVLVGILPTIMGTGENFDKLGHESPLFYYCMVPATNMDAEETDQAWETTLAGARAIEEAIKENINDTDWLLEV
jgi:hypothetical protein